MEIKVLYAGKGHSRYEYDLLTKDQTGPAHSVNGRHQCWQSTLHAEHAGLLVSSSYVLIYDDKCV